MIYGHGITAVRNENTLKAPPANGYINNCVAFLPALNNVSNEDNVSLLYKL